MTQNFSTGPSVVKENKFQVTLYSALENDTEKYVESWEDYVPARHLLKCNGYD